VVGGRRVDLTRLEFELLDYLYQRQGKVVDRSDLLRDVWGYTHVGSNVIDTVVRSLRKKLGEAGVDDRDCPRPRLSVCDSKTRSLVGALRQAAPPIGSASIDEPCPLALNHRAL
jgi:hypothetical protein